MRLKEKKHKNIINFSQLSSLSSRKSILISEASERDLCRDLLFNMRRLNGRLLSVCMANENSDKITGIIWKIATYISFSHVASFRLIYWWISVILWIINQFNGKSRRDEMEDKMRQLTVIRVFNSPWYQCTRLACSPRRRYFFLLPSRDHEGNSVEFLKIERGEWQVTSGLSMLTSHHLKALFTFNSSASM